MSFDPITLYHYAKCSKSRATLALLTQKGLNPHIINYLESPLTADSLRKLQQQLGFQHIRQLMRPQETLYQTLKLSDSNLSENELIQHIITHPILLERPIVVYQQRAKIGRPPEAILALFENDSHA